MSALPGRMNRKEDRLYQPAARERAGTPGPKPATMLQQLRAIVAIEARQRVPWQGRLQMMRDMQVVVEEQQPEERIRFDDRGALAGAPAGAVLDEGAQQPQAEARIGDHEPVVPPRHAANARDEPEQR